MAASPDLIQQEGHRDSVESVCSLLLPLLQQDSADPLRILEVGCGNGLFSLMLRGAIEKVKQEHPNNKTRPFSMTLIDSSEMAAHSAKELGVEIQVVGFLEFRSDPFDVLLFTRSLHHIFPLEQAVVHSKELLKPGGIAIFEEFCRDIGDVKSIQWLFDSTELLEAGGIFHTSPKWNQGVQAHGEHQEHQGHSHNHHHHPTQGAPSHTEHQQHDHHHHHHPTQGVQAHGEHQQHSHHQHHHPHHPMPAELVNDNTVLGRWKRYHYHDPPLPGRNELIGAVKKVFEHGNNHVVIQEGLPYYYHYLVMGLDRTHARALDVLKTFREQEKRKIQNQEIVGFGMRMIAKNI